MLTSEGRIRIRAYTAGGALPIEGATVRIMGAEEDNRLISYSLMTDRDGLTESVALPAPDVNFSLSPSPSEKPYALYDIEITAPGYYSKNINGLSVFSGIESVQLINMIPEGSRPIEDYPRSNINADIPENNQL